jgi:hypothetical protein
MHSLDAVEVRNADKIVKFACYEDLKKALKQHKMAAMFVVEGMEETGIFSCIPHEFICEPGTII